MLTLSPQMVLLAQVLNVKEASLMSFQAVLSRIVRQNLVSGNHVNGLGICSRKVFDLNRYGCGACCMILYAMTLLGCTTYSSPVLSVIWCIKPFPDSANRPLPVTVVLPQCARLFANQPLAMQYLVYRLPSSGSILASSSECAQSKLGARCGARSSSLAAHPDVSRQGM